MHSLLLLAFSHAQFGRQASSVVWDALLSADSQFVRSARAVESRATNMSSFLASIAATRSNGAAHEAELNRATAEVVSDLNTLLSKGLLSGCGKVREELADTRVFARVVGMATGSSQVDTRVFAALFDAASSSGAEEAGADEEETLCMRALRDVKQMRAARLRCA